MMRYRGGSYGATIALACVGLWLAGCPADEPRDDANDGVDTGGGDAGAHHDSSSFQPMGTIGGASDPTTAAGDGGAPGGGEQAQCDGPCVTADDCASGQSCIQFELGRKCAPIECLGCENGCIYDLRDCSFTRCMAEPPPGAPDSCGHACSDDGDCGGGQGCIDVFGIGECAPRDCADCSGFCDYDARSCSFDACYMDVGSTMGPSDPVLPPFRLPTYCGHQF